MNVIKIELVRKQHWFTSCNFCSKRVRWLIIVSRWRASCSYQYVYVHESGQTQNFRSWKQWKLKKFLGIKGKLQSIINRNLHYNFIEILVQQPNYLSSVETDILRFATLHMTFHQKEYCSFPKQLWYSISNNYEWAIEINRYSSTDG